MVQSAVLGVEAQSQSGGISSVQSSSSKLKWGIWLCWEQQLRAEEVESNWPCWEWKLKAEWWSQLCWERQLKAEWWS